MQVGFQGYNRVLKWEFRIGNLLVFIYNGAYALWALNNLAIILNSIADDRYVTLDFWRLGFVFPNILTSSFTTLMLYNNLKTRGFYPYWVQCILCILALFAGGVWIVWGIVDIVNCATVVYCVGNGISVLGTDLAFIVAFILQIAMWLHNLAFLYLGYRVRNRVKRIQMLDSSVDLNAQPITNNNPPFQVTSVGYIGTEVNDVRQRMSQQQQLTKPSLNDVELNKFVPTSAGQYTQHFE